MTDHRSNFFEIIKPRFKGNFSTGQKAGLIKILDMCCELRIGREGTATSLAEIFHETGRTMQPVAENLNYSYEGLRTTFPKYFKSKKVAEAYARNPEAIANRAYANRIGNGDEASGDGWRFRGMGPIQLTGRANYRRVGQHLGIELEIFPELAMNPKYAYRIALQGMRDGWFTGVRLADVIAGVDEEIDFTDDRAMVNGRDKAAMIAQIAEDFYIALEGVDLLSKSRTIKAVKKQNVGAIAGTINSALSAASQAVVQSLGNPETAAQAGAAGQMLSQFLPWLGGLTAVIAIAAFGYMKFQANQIEKARREDAEDE